MGYLLFGVFIGYCNYNFQKKRFTKGIAGMNRDERKYQVKVRAEEKNKFDRMTEIQKMKDVGFDKGNPF